MPHSVKPSWSSLPPFETLDLCLAHVQERHPQRQIAHRVKGLGTEESFDGTIPAYLYRGEVGWFDTCVSRKERVRRNHFPGVALVELEAVGQDLDEELQTRLGLDPMLSHGLMQHYGFPTELIDVTTSLKTACFFARFEARGTAEGAFAVIDTAALLSKPGSTVIDLSQHHAALRAIRQEAYGLFHRQHSNLKDPQAIVDMGITWYTYRKDPLEMSRVESGKALLSVGDDHTSGILRLWLDGSIAKHSKVSHPVAEYLALRVAHCPMVTKVISWHGPGQPKEVELIPAGLAGIEINQQLEIDDSLQLWSRSYPDVLSRPRR